MRKATLVIGASLLVAFGAAVGLDPGRNATSALARGVHVTKSQGATVAGPDSPFELSVTPRVKFSDSSFLEMYEGQSPRGVAEQVSVGSGRPLGVAIRLPSALVSGYGRAADGAMWLTASTGPQGLDYPSSATHTCPAGGCPTKPNSCAGAVIRIAPNGHEASTIWRPSSSVLIADAIPSPGNREIAFVAQGCGNDGFEQYLGLRNLASGSQWTVVSPDPSCHGPVSPPSWSADGSHVVFTYAPAGPIPAGGPLPQGTCQQWRRSEIAIIPARQNTSLTARYLTAAPAPCRYTQAVYDRAGILAIKTCGPTDPSADRAYLVQLGPTRNVTKQLMLGSRPDGVSLAVSPDRTHVLISEYQSPAYSPRYIGPQVTIWTYNTDKLRSIRTYKGLGTGIAVSW